MKELFRDGNWRLVQTCLSQGLAGLQHRCEKNITRGWWYFIYEQCDGCHSKPPEAIIGLHTLYNWDSK